MKILTESGWKQVDEPVELDELSNDLLSRYAERAIRFGQDAYDAGNTRNDAKKTRLLKTANRRKNGINLLIRKLSRERDPAKKGSDEYSKRPPLTESVDATLKSAASQIIQDVLPDLEDALIGSGESVYNAVIDHLADRLHDEFSKKGYSGSDFQAAAKWAAGQHVHDDREESKKKQKYAKKDQQRRDWKKQGLTTRGTSPKPRIKKATGPKYDRVGFKTKLAGRLAPGVRKGTGSHGHAKYAVSEANYPGLSEPIKDKLKDLSDQEMQKLMKSFGEKKSKKVQPLKEDTMKSTLQVIKEAAKAANKPKPKSKAKPANPKVAMGGSGDTETGYEDFISAATDDSNLDKVYDKMREALKIKIAAAAMHGNTSKVKLLKKRLANLDKHRDGDSGNDKEDKD